MKEYFNGKHGGLILLVKASQKRLSVRVAGSLTGSAEMDEISEVDLIGKFLRRNGGQRYETVYLDVSHLDYVDTYGMGALEELMRLGRRVVIVGLARGLSRSDLNVVTWLALRGECVDKMDDDDIGYAA